MAEARQTGNQVSEMREAMRLPRQALASLLRHMARLILGLA